MGLHIAAADQDILRPAVGAFLVGDTALEVGTGPVEDRHTPAVRRIAV